MASITIGQCFKGAWTDGTRAIIEHPVFTLAVFALMLCLASFQLQFHPYLPGMDPAARLHASVIQFGLTLLHGLLVSCLAVHATRFSLDNGASSRLKWLIDGTWLRYIGLFVGLGFVIAFAIAATALICAFGVAFLSKTSGVRLAPFAGMLSVAVPLSVLAVLGTYPICRISLLFCHIAFGGKLAWRAAWNDSRGHVWSMIGTHLLVSLPFFAMLIVLVLIGRQTFISGLANSVNAAHGFDGSIGSWVALVQTLWTIIGISVGASCSAWLYRRFASTILEAS